MLALVVLLFRVIYLVCVSTLILYTGGQLYLLYTYVRHNRASGADSQGLPQLPEELLPRVTVQLPLYNERYVARRIIDAVAALDYPRDLLHIQVLDDSTDDTTELIRGRIDQLQADGLRIDLLHRENRSGYKAGALAIGLEQTDGEFIAIFDADFIPEPSFLRNTIPHFYQDDRIGVVQTRWGHLNDADNILTRSQALAIDSHFAVEQFARSAGDLIFSFNGTGGLWRRTCIDDAGGWNADTLTEDFDLSYRAQIKGWRFKFVRDVVVPGEIPPQMHAYKQQQARWAKGSTQVLLKLALPLLRSNLNFRKRFMGMLQLFQYAIQPIMLLTLLLTPLMVLTRSVVDISIAPVGIMGFGAPLLCILGQRALYPDWHWRSAQFPILMLFSSGMAVNNSRAALSALMKRPSEFNRTPKFHIDAKAQIKAKAWNRSPYVSLIGNDMIWEIAFFIYTASAAFMCYQIAPGFTLYFLIYAAAFASVAGWELADKWAVQRSLVPATKTEVEPVRQIGR
jgi:cellulose synthase/poly-beta-1,6-N-acetylglucosamine synthase-like glycosyltransferase